MNQSLISEERWRSSGRYPRGAGGPCALLLRRPCHRRGAVPAIMRCLSGTTAVGSLAVLALFWAPLALSQDDVAIRGGDGTPVVEDPAAQERDFAVAAPGYTRLADGLFVRKVVEASGGTYSAVVWMMVVSPGSSTPRAKLPGAALLTVRSGRTVLITDAGKQELELGATAFVPEGQTASFDNVDAERPAILRAVFVSGAP